MVSMIFLVFVVVFDAFLIPIIISRFFRRLEGGFQLRFRRSIGHHHHFVFAVVKVFSNEKTTTITTITTEEFLSELSRRARGFPHVCALCFFYSSSKAEARIIGGEMRFKVPLSHTKRHARNQLINFEKRAHLYILFVQRKTRAPLSFFVVTLVWTSRRRSKKKKGRRVAGSVCSEKRIARSLSRLLFAFSMN